MDCAYESCETAKAMQIFLAFLLRFSAVSNVNLLQVFLLSRGWTKRRSRICV